jgi:hypothetical protein
VVWIVHGIRFILLLGVVPGLRGKEILTMAW